jgi:hypothetical protein
VSTKVTSIARKRRKSLLAGVHHVRLVAGDEAEEVNADPP